MRIFCAGFPYGWNDQDLGSFFCKAGAVQFARVITDRETGKSKGFGFIEMETDEASERAISLNGSVVNGRRLTINEARDTKR